MTASTQSTSPVRNEYADAIRFDGGVREGDRPLVASALRHLLTRLEPYPAPTVALALHVKDRGRPSMRTTLELAVPHRPVLRASAEGELGAALNRIGDVLVQELNQRR